MLLLKRDHFRMLLFKRDHFEESNKKLKMNFEGYRETHSEPCHKS